jgi:hypothetical protein
MKTTKSNREMLFASNCAFGFDHAQIKLEEVRQHLAQAMIGKTVDLFSGRAVAHGVVSGVMLLAGHPKLLVNGRAYDLNQVLTASPA